MSQENLLALELRRALEQKDANDVIVQGKIANLEKMLDATEAKNADVVAKLNLERKANEELKESIEAIEKKLLRANASSVKSFKESSEYKAYENLLRFGKDYVMQSGEVKYLRTDNNVQGGYLAPEEYVTEIIRNITEISPVRQVSRVRTTTRSSIEMPRRTELLEAFWVGEGANIPDAQSFYGLETIKVNKLAVYTVATLEMLSDAAFNMESEINQDIVERFAQKEGQAFINGNGVEKPEGILFNSDVQSINSGVANDITADALIELTGELKTGYNPMFMLNRRTLARIRRLKDGNGQYLWAAGISEGQPNTILGYPYASAIDVPDIAPGATPVIFGDFMRSYTIVDHNSISMLRDDYTLSTQGKVKFVSHRRVGGQVVLPEAIKKLTVGV